MGFSRQEYWNVLLFPFPGDLQVWEPGPPILQAGALPSEPPGNYILFGLSVYSLFGLSIPNSDLENCTFLGIYPFLIGCPICWHTTLDSVFFYDCIS